MPSLYINVMIKKQSHCFTESQFSIHTQILFSIMMFFIDEYLGTATEELESDPRDKEILPETETTCGQTVIGEAQKNIQGI